MPDRLSNTNILGLSKPVITVIGPTASGKSSLAIELAQALDGEVISADSMQIYKGMDIGTGKVLAEDQIVPHFGFDLVEPGMPFSAALFQDYARDRIKDIDVRSKQPILCGGTGFYIRSVIDGYEFPPGEQIGNQTRDQYNRFAQEHGAQALWDMLKEKDEASASLIAPRDTKRVVRAFELLEEGTSYADQKINLASLPQVVPAVFIGLEVDPALLNERIDARVEMMIASGFMDEVKLLLDKGLRTGITAPQAIGYKELVAVNDGRITLEEALQSIKIATHRYAKRQRTWFRKDQRINWISANDLDISRMTTEALAIIRSAQEY